MKKKNHKIMNVLCKQKYAIVILFCLIITNICIANKGATGDKDCYDVELLKKPFQQIAYKSVVPLTKELEFNTKTFSEIKKIIGKPIEEYMDTFIYGNFYSHKDSRIDQYYDYFPNKLWNKPRLIIRRCIWYMGNKDIILFFANDCKNGEQPFWGYVEEHDLGDSQVPLRLLPEKGLSLCKVIAMRGKPTHESIYTIKYGFTFHMPRDIYALRNVPEATVHEYQWELGDSRLLVLIYLENEDTEKSKPISGMLCKNAYWEYE